jgi:hypothetical protein
LSLNEWAMTLVASSSLDPVWIEVLGDPLLRRLLLRSLTYLACQFVIPPPTLVSVLGDKYAS